MTDLEGGEIVPPAPAVPVTVYVQFESGSGVEEQVPLHCHVPLDCVWLQTFWVDGHAASYVLPPGIVTAGGGGGVPVHVVPSQPMVPVLAEVV